jgi:hypothetical protein
MQIYSVFKQVLIVEQLTPLHSSLRHFAELGRTAAIPRPGVRPDSRRWTPVCME